MQAKPYAQKQTQFQVAIKVCRVSTDISDTRRHSLHTIQPNLDLVISIIKCSARIRRVIRSNQFVTGIRYCSTSQPSITTTKTEVFYSSGYSLKLVTRNHKILIKLCRRSSLKCILSVHKTKTDDSDLIRAYAHRITYNIMCIFNCHIYEHRI